MSFDMETPSLSSAISRARPACTPVLKSTRELRKPCKNLAKRGSRWVHLSPKRVSMHREGSLERSTRLSFILKHSSLSLTPLESVPCTSKAPTRWRTCTAALCHTRLNAEPLHQVARGQGRGCDPSILLAASVHRFLLLVREIFRSTAS